MNVLPDNQSSVNLEEKFKHIPGWGIDADPRNEPTYPMKEWTGDDHERLNYEKYPQQPINIELLQSIERPVPTRVFGSSVPPSGLSGMIRRFAFKFSESTYARWVPLILADRVNMIEGVIDDLMHGHITNPIKERGWTAEWKYNRKECVQNIIVGVAAVTALAFLLSSRKKAKKKRQYMMH